MSKKKKENTKGEETRIPDDHNPADSGFDHNVSVDPETDHDNSYIDKQEARENRGEDNEDTTD